MPTVTVQESDCAPAISAVALPSVLVLEVVSGCVGSVTLSWAADHRKVALFPAYAALQWLRRAARTVRTVVSWWATRSAHPWMVVSLTGRFVWDSSSCWWHCPPSCTATRASGQMQLLRLQQGTEYVTGQSPHSQCRFFFNLVSAMVSAKVGVEWSFSWRFLETTHSDMWATNRSLILIRFVKLTVLCHDVKSPDKLLRWLTGLLSSLLENHTLMSDVHCITEVLAKGCHDVIPLLPHGSCQGKHFEDVIGLRAHRIEQSTNLVSLIIFVQFGEGSES